MRTFSGLLAAAIVVLGFAAPAQASLITLDGGTAGTLPNGASNEFLNPLFGGSPSATGYYGSQIKFDTGGQLASIVIEFYGAEAGYNNEFNFMLAELFDHPGGTILAINLSTPLNTFASTIIGAGLLPFTFDINGDATQLLNGSNPNDSAGAALGPNFLASCAPLGPGNPTACDSVYLFLDDGGAGPDDDHDDFLVRITLTSVPEPSSLALFGVGLVAIGLIKRRRKKNAPSP